MAGRAIPDLPEGTFPGPRYIQITPQDNVRQAA
jgi:hypothetical protein